MTATPNQPPVSLAPMLSVRRGVEALAFYKAAFGAHELFKIEDNGSVVAEISVQGAKFWVADESPPHQNFSPETLGGCNSPTRPGSTRPPRRPRSGARSRGQGSVSGT